MDFTKTNIVSFVQSWRTFSLNWAKLRYIGYFESLLHLSESKTIFSLGQWLGALETHILITFLWSFFYKSPVIKVTLLEFENNSTHSTRLMLIYLIVLVKQFKHQMSKLDIKINCIHLWYVFLLVSDMYVTFYTKLLIMTTNYMY